MSYIQIPDYEFAIYDPVNDANPKWNIGSSATNRGYIQAVYDSGAQTLDYLLLSTDSATEGDICIVPKTGNYVGIGTTDPDELLHVKGGGDTRIAIDAPNGADAVLEFGQDVASGSTWGIGFDDSASDSFVIAYTATGNPSLTGNGLVSIDTSGNVGIGVSSPTAHLHLKAGTASVGTAPLKFTSGTNLTTPEAGAIEFDGSYLYYTDSTPARHQIATGGSVTLDGAYNGGNTIDVDGDPVTLTVSDGDNNSALKIIQNDVTNNPYGVEIENNASLVANSISLVFSGSNRSFGSADDGTNLASMQMMMIANNPAPAGNREMTIAAYSYTDEHVDIFIDSRQMAVGAGYGQVYADADQAVNIGGLSHTPKVNVGRTTGTIAVDIEAGSSEDITFAARGGTAITLNESGEDSLDGSFAATSIIGALNELADDIAIFTLDDAYDNDTGERTITIDDGTVSWNIDGEYNFDVYIEDADGYGFQVYDDTDYFRLYKHAAGGSINLSAELRSCTINASASMYITCEDIIYLNPDQDVRTWVATNDGNPEWRVGSSTTNEAHLQAVYDSGAQTLDYFLISTDSDTEGDICIVPKTGNNVGIGTTDPAYKLTVGSADASNYFAIEHDNTDVYFRTDDGEFNFITDEGTNTDTIVNVQGKGTGAGYFRAYDEDSSEAVEITCTNGVGQISTIGTSAGHIALMPGSGSRVGVGTTTPYSQFMVANGEVFIDHSTGGGSNGAAFRFGTNSSQAFINSNTYYYGGQKRTRTGGAAEIDFDVSSGATAGDIDFRTATNGSAGSAITFTKRLTISDASGIQFFDKLDVSAQNIETDTTTGTQIATAAAQKIGFFGATPVVQATEITDELTSITHTAPGTPDYAIQDLTNTSPYGFVTQDEGNTVLSVIANLQARVNELETALATYGLLADAD